MSPPTVQASDPLRADAPLRLVFSGECREGFDPQAVRSAVAGALKLDEPRAARLFSGKRVVLQRQVDVVVAHRHIARFAQMGAVVRAEPAKRAPPRVEPMPTARPPAAVAHARWRRPLRWAGTGMLCIVVGLTLGLALGPGLNSLWPDPHSPGSGSGSGTVAAARAVAVRPFPQPPAPGPAHGPATAEPAVAASVHAQADGVIAQDMSAASMRDYRLHYLRAAGHKAFAVSSGGAHAWHAGAASEDEARERALAGCMKAQRTGDEGCRVVDADGRWPE